MVTLFIIICLDISCQTVVAANQPARVCTQVAVESSLKLFKSKHPEYYVLKMGCVDGTTI